MTTRDFLPSSSARRNAVSMAAGAALFALPLWASPASAQPLVYYGGPVVSNVEVVQVSWSSGVDATYQADLTKFYQVLLASTYLDWLVEYDTFGLTGYADGLPGSEQHIGRGTFAGAFVISPENTSAALTDADISAELAAQIASGALPAPKLDAAGNVDSIYMIDFPANTTITGPGGVASCGVFDAYHAAVLIDGAAVPYGVHPDCGQTFGRATTVHSHELVEAITDPATSLALGLARPMAWRMAVSLTGADEISDICEAPGIGVGIVEGYKVTKNSSNFANACVVSIPVCDGTMTPPECRPCSPFDAGFACSGSAPLCAEDGPKAGQCIGCTADNTSACAGETPLCDLATNTCVSCLESSDCKGAAASVCDETTRVCRGCSANEECSSGLCDTDADAQAGQCVECMADADCGGEKVCEEHTCAERPTQTPAGKATDDGGCAIEAPGSDGEPGGGFLLLALGALCFSRRRRAGRASRIEASSPTTSSAVRT